jgi:hypothetical protein
VIAAAKPAPVKPAAAPKRVAAAAKKGPGNLGNIPKRRSA